MHACTVKLHNCTPWVDHEYQFMIVFYSACNRIIYVLSLMVRDQCSLVIEPKICSYEHNTYALYVMNCCYQSLSQLQFASHTYSVATATDYKLTQLS